MVNETEHDISWLLFDVCVRSNLDSTHPEEEQEKPDPDPYPNFLLALTQGNQLT